MGFLLMLGNTFLDKVARPSSAEVGDQALRTDQGPAINGAQTTADTALTHPPIGAIGAWAGDADPPGGKYAICDGRLLNIDDYPECAAVCQTKYAHGDEPPGTFRIPDCRGRVPLGAGQGTGLTNRAAGATGGGEKHALTTGEMASHNHTEQSVTQIHQHGDGTTSEDNWTHHHFTGIDNFEMSGNFGAGRRVYSPDTWPDPNVSEQSTDVQHIHDHDIASETMNHAHVINNAGGGTPHENMPPFLSINTIIRVAL